MKTIVWLAEELRDVEWIAKPRGTHWAQLGEFEADIFLMGMGTTPARWRWNLLHTETQQYESFGYSENLQEAKRCAFGRARLGHLECCDE
jgi:hypothetical protein